MAARGLIRDFLLGKDRIDSRTEYKEALLRGQFGFLIGAICFSYIFIDLLNGVTQFIPFYLVGIVVAGVIIAMNRNRKSKSASIIILVFSNLIIYLFATVDSPLGGVFLYFTATSAAALILFARTDRYVGYIFVVISLLLGLLAYILDWSPISALIEPTSYELTSFVTNYVIGMLCCVMIINFAISRNNESEKSLENSIQAREAAEVALIKKNEELEKANQELDRFVYSASHDMRAPLSSLLGLMEIVRLTNKDEELNEYFVLMKKRILTMEGFIKEITDYSRNARTDIEVEEIRLIDLINEVLTTIDFLAHDAGIKRKLNIPADLVIKCDVARLKVIMSNLITNSIKYHNASKSDKWFKVSAREEGNGYVIEVSDNGIGIADQYQDKIFDMFFRATEGSEGSGLGLYIVRETVEKLSGKISCDSTLGKGSTFTLYLPKNPSGFTQSEMPKEPESMASNL